MCPEKWEDQLGCAVDSEAVEEVVSAIRDRQGVYLNKLTPEVLHKAECMYIVAPLPNGYAARLQYLGDLLAQMGANHKVADDQLRTALRSLSAAFSYLLNCSSFRDGKLHGYDADELARKLRPLTNW